MFNVVLSVFDLLLPKKNQVCFYITPRTSWDTNQQVLYAKLRHRTEIVVVDGNDINPNSVLIILKSIWRLARSKTIIFDHSIPSGLRSGRHINVNVWHGSPIKKIRFLSVERFDKKFLIEQSKITDLVVSASSYDALLLCSALNVPYFNVTTFGLPRNDYLTCQRTELEDIDLYSENDVIESIVQEYDKSILFAPTYRGDSHIKNDPMLFDEVELVTLEKYLLENNIVFLVRSHKFSSFSDENRLLKMQNVIDVSDFRNPMLLLRHTDLLVTDYSSIWVDYLLLNRPIIIYTPDIDNYTKEHGFIFDFMESIPCKPLYAFNELILSIDERIKSKSISKKQTQFYDKYHGTKAISSSDELLKILL
ncbi:CDP-glycerol glycerophosphotransferase family protein [Vibrio superstes]|nr:CDP-glycerol glycerophosphotransferase family protein [Vibrio superstes]